MGHIIIPSKPGRIKSPKQQSIHQGIFNGSITLHAGRPIGTPGQSFDVNIEALNSGALSCWISAKSTEMDP